MSRILRAALTETRNVYGKMPPSTDAMSTLAGRLDEIRDANLDHHAELISEAASAGARVIGLGELFSAPYFALTRDPLWLGMAEEIAGGPSISRMQEAAAHHRIVIVAPIYELDGDTGRRFNTAVVIESDGRILGSTRKCHIPCGSNEEGSFQETFYYQASDGRMANENALGDNPFFPVFATSAGRIGVSICYDRHFEGVMGSLAAAGAELVFSPAVTFGDKSRRLWPVEFATDAARHAVFIGAS
ncbi:MAG: nitrilase-related carbon-nitrogen hydrolase, partial [Planctomycetota bacterium]